MTGSRALRAAPGGIEMVQCEMVYTKKEEWVHQFWGGGWGKETERRMDHRAPRAENGATPYERVWR
jgi:hypothetical protein